MIEDRARRRATIITRQLPVAHWHEAMGDETLADAMLDRLGYNPHRVELRCQNQCEPVTRGQRILHDVALELTTIDTRQTRLRFANCNPHQSHRKEVSSGAQINSRVGRHTAPEITARKLRNVCTDWPEFVIIISRKRVVRKKLGLDVLAFRVREWVPCNLAHVAARHDFANLNSVPDGFNPLRPGAPARILNLLGIPTTMKSQHLP